MRTRKKTPAVKTVLIDGKAQLFCKEGITGKKLLKKLTKNIADKEALSKIEFLTFNTSNNAK